MRCQRIVYRAAFSCECLPCPSLDNHVQHKHVTCRTSIFDKSRLFGQTHLIFKIHSMRRIAPSLLQCSSHSKLSLPLLSPHLLHTLPQDSAPPPPATLYDWRTRATSRRKPGGIIEPPREIKSVKYKRRKEAETEEWFEGRRYHTAIENYKAK